MTVEQERSEPSRNSLRRQIDWEKAYQQHAWDYLAGMGETPRYSAVAGYVQKLLHRGSILDAGCGEGVLIEYFDLNRFDYTGFDLSPTAIDRARQRHAGANLLCCSLEDFSPPQNKRYDLIIFNEVLTSFQNAIEILNRFYTFLQPSGHIIVSQFQSSDPNSNASIFTPMFEAEIAAGRYPLVAKSEVLNCETGYRWRVYCLGDFRRAG